MHESLGSSLPRDLAEPHSADPYDDPARLELLVTVLRIMDEHRVDALAYPTWNNPPRLVGDVDSPHGNNSPYISPHTGQPAITVPMGSTQLGLPAGLQLLGRPFSEPTLLSLAYAYEQATKHRWAPKRFPPLGAVQTTAEKK